VAAVTHLRVAQERPNSDPLPVAGLAAPRVRVMLLVASGALAAVAGAATCPTAAAIMLAVLDALVVAASLRGPQRAALSVSLLAALSFVSLRLVTSPAAVDAGTDPGGLLRAVPSLALLDEGTWASALFGAGTLLASSALALWCAEGLGSSTGAASPAPALATAAAPRGAEVVGRARADWLLAEARRGRRLVTLGLIGVDAPADYELEPGEREGVMVQLDEMLSSGLAGQEALSEYGPWERLLVLPDVWAEDFREQAATLVKTARQRIRRPVRVALITFPLDGPGASEPFEYLERSLEVCRAGRSSVSVGRPRIRRMTPNDEIA
jgi:hypothetical protein